MGKTEEDMERFRRNNGRMAFESGSFEKVYREKQFHFMFIEFITKVLQV